MSEFIFLGLSNNRNRLLLIGRSIFTCNHRYVHQTAWRFEQGVKLKSIFSLYNLLRAVHLPLTSQRVFLLDSSTLKQPFAILLPIQHLYTQHCYSQFHSICISPSQILFLATHTPFEFVTLSAIMNKFICLYLNLCSSTSGGSLFLTRYRPVPVDPLMSFLRNSTLPTTRKRPVLPSLSFLDSQI